MKIVFIASEMVPFAKTGGLADVAGTLSSQVQDLGHEVVCVLPKYQSIDSKRYKLTKEVSKLDIAVGSSTVSGEVYGTELDNGMKVLLIEQADFFNREELYGTPHGDYPDNDRRFVFFQLAALEALKKLKFKPDVIHCHDWQTGLIPVYLKSLYAKDSFYSKTRSIFTIHNLAYQGNFPPDSLRTTGLGWDQFTMERLEFYGKISFMKGGILDADVITTVSEQYAEEIQSKEFGCGLEGVLSSRDDTLHGILNGIDPGEWDPENDKDLVENFTANDLKGKAASKKALQKENDFSQDEKTPVIGIISRLVDQKGMDILIPVIPDIIDLGAQFVLLGTGEEKYHQLLRQLAKKHFGYCGIHILFDELMAKQIYAGCDMFLVPSYYEPCGLGQLISLRFGTVPIVRKIGGLADTIEEFDAQSGAGNGFLFEDYSSKALLSSISRAVKAYRDPQAWAKLVGNAFACDFSWRSSAKKYVQIYEQTKRRKVGDLES